MYQITFARSARRELQNFPRDMAERLLQKIETLADTPRPHGCVKLKGTSDLWRIRSGDYRVIYRVDDPQQIVDIVVVRHRKDAYE